MGELGTLYGMLLESVSTYLRRLYGEEMWVQIVDKSGVQFLEYATHTRYPVMTPVAIAEACVELLDGIPPNPSSATIDSAAPGASTSDKSQATSNVSGPGASSSIAQNGVDHSNGIGICQGDQVMVTVSDPSGTICTPLIPNSNNGTCTLIEQITLPGKKADLGDFLELWGCWFVDYCSTYGFDRIMRAAGRHFMDFLMNIDNLHETMRFTFPRMRTPSFMVDHETPNGCYLHYRSKRKGFSRYVMGQLKTLGRRYYNIEVEVRLLSEGPEGGDAEAEVCKNSENETAGLEGDTEGIGWHIVFELQFHNESKRRSQERLENRKLTIEMPFVLEFEPISSSFFFGKVFPFSFAFREDMCIIRHGPSLMYLVPSVRNVTRREGRTCLLGVHVPSFLRLRRPCVQLTWNNAVIFEMEVVQKTKTALEGASTAEGGGGASKGEGNTAAAEGDGKASLLNAGTEAAANGESDRKQSVSSRNLMHSRTGTRCVIKGQMKFVPTWNAILCICSPLIDNVQQLVEVGLYVGDLSCFDSSRDFVFNGMNRASTLEYLIEQQMETSRLISEKTKTLQQFKEDGDRLLYNMIPPSVARRLRTCGGDTLKTCEEFSSATVMFAYLTEFAELRNSLAPMQCVQLVNEMIDLCDHIADGHSKVYKIGKRTPNSKAETLCDALYMVVSGVPDRCDDHAFNITELALDLLRSVRKMHNPADEKVALHLRVGIHTGSLVAGVVGYKTLQYCLFGDTVNIASRMQSTGLSDYLQISDATWEQLKPSRRYVIVHRGSVSVKGKGLMNTWILVGRLGEVDLIERVERLKPYLD